MTDERIVGVLHTKYDELNFFDAEVYPNEEGNVCIKLNEKSYVVLTPIMAKRLYRDLDDAIRSSLGMVLGAK